MISRNQNNNLVGYGSPNNNTGLSVRSGHGSIVKHTKSHAALPKKSDMEF